MPSAVRKGPSMSPGQGQQEQRDLAAILAGECRVTSELAAAGLGLVLRALRRVASPSDFDDVLQGVPRAADWMALVPSAGVRSNSQELRAGGARTSVEWLRDELFRWRLPPRFAPLAVMRLSDALGAPLVERLVEVQQVRELLDLSVAPDGA